MRISQTSRVVLDDGVLVDMYLKANGSPFGLVFTLVVWGRKMIFLHWQLNCMSSTEIFYRVEGNLFDNL